MVLLPQHKIGQELRQAFQAQGIDGAHHMQASQSLAQMAYAAQACGAEAAPSGDKGDSDVLDAEFEEVKGDDKDRKAS
jgi:hypothetical protein